MIITSEHPEQPGRVPVGELREWASIKRTTHEQEGNDDALRVLDELREVIERYDQ